MVGVIGPAQKLKIFLDHYAKLSTIAFSLKNMAGHFVSARIISTDENQELQHSTKKSEIACLILNNISDSLKMVLKRNLTNFYPLWKTVKIPVLYM